VHAEEMLIRGTEHERDALGRIHLMKGNILRGIGERQGVESRRHEGRQES
jgi:hypothetical protein